MELKSAIEYVFSTVEYYIVVGLVMFISEQAGLIEIRLLSLVLSGFLGFYLVIPILPIIPNRSVARPQYWGRIALYILLSCVILALHIFVLGRVMRAVSEGIGA